MTPLQQQPQQIQLTPEEINRRLHRFEVTDDLVEQIFGANATPQQRKALLQQMLDGAVKNALTSSQVIFDHKLGEHQSDYKTVKEMAQELYRDRMFDHFYKANPTLKDYDKIVQDAVTAVAGQSDVPSDQTTLFERIATESASRIKQLKPDFALVPGVAGGQPTGQKTAMPASGAASAAIVPTATDAGGFQGGGAGKPTTLAKPGQADSVWDDD